MILYGLAKSHSGSRPPVKDVARTPNAGTSHVTQRPSVKDVARPPNVGKQSHSHKSAIFFNADRIIGIATLKCLLDAYISESLYSIIRHLHSVDMAVFVCSD